MNKLSIFEPQIEIVTWDEGSLFTSAKNEQIVIDNWKSRSPIQVGEKVISGSAIKCIKPAKMSFNLSGVSGEHREAIAARIKKFEDNLARSPKQETILVWLEKLMNGERI